MPHHSTWSRGFGDAGAVDALERLLGQCVQAPQATSEVLARGARVLAVDGTTLRGTIPRGQPRGGHLGAAYLPAEGVVVAHVAVATKENKIVAVPTPSTACSPVALPSDGCQPTLRMPWRTNLRHCE